MCTRLPIFRDILEYVCNMNVHTSSSICGCVHVRGGDLYVGGPYIVNTRPTLQTKNGPIYYMVPRNRSVQHYTAPGILLQAESLLLHSCNRIYGVPFSAKTPRMDVRTQRCLDLLSNQGYIIQQCRTPNKKQTNNKESQAEITRKNK